MTDRPRIQPGVLAEITDSVPSRLQKKLDRQPDAAESWDWQDSTEGSWDVRAGSEVVSLSTALISAIDDVSCSCLLGPRCFHVLAVLSVLSIDTDELPEEKPNASVEIAEQDWESQAPNAATTDVAVLSENQLLAVECMQEVLANILSAGLRAAGTVLQSRLLRSIHECRCEGLHRLSAAALRIMANVRAVRSERDTFDSEQAEADLLEALEVSTRLTRNVTSEWLGVARRRYRPVKNMKLHGLCCEPILTRSGYSGVVTYMIADDGWICSISDVQPGTGDRIPQAWKSGVSVAGLAMSHRELSRSSLLISKATKSDDGRIGGAESARAVATEGDGWQAAPIRSAFKTPLADQIRNAFRRRRMVGSDRAAGFDFLFLNVEIVGAFGAVLIAKTDDGATLRLAIAVDCEDVRFRDNVTMLARCPGLKLRCLARVNFQLAGTVELIAVGPSEDEVTGNPVLQFDDECRFHADLGLDVISRGKLSSAERQPVEVELVEDVQPNQDEILARWLRAIVLGGRHAVPSSAVDTAMSDALKLNRQLRRTASGLLGRLAESVIDTETDVSGVRFPGNAAALAESWLATAVVRRASMDAVQQHDWLAISGEAEGSS